MGKRKIDFTITDGGIFTESSIKKKPPLIQKSAATKRPPLFKKELPEERQPVLPETDRGAGARRAARLLLALGPDRAADILKEMEDREIETLVLEMTRIKKISAEEKRQILEEFEKNVQDFDEPVRGGMDRTMEILSKGLGEEKANEIFSRLNRHDLKKDFHFLEQIDPRILANSLSQEHPQIAAVALSFISPRVAATVMKLIPAELRSQVAIRIARTSTTHPEALQRVARVLREKFEKRKEEIYSDTGGAETLANILNHMDRGTEDSILGILGNQAPELLENVKDRLYTFEELIHLNTRETRILLAKVNDDQLLATALRGVGEELRRHFFNSLSQNRAADVMEVMDRRGPVTIREVNDARGYVLSVARQLDEEGAIVIKKEKEEYI